MNTQYKTRTLAFAAFLVAGKHLRLDHVEVTDSLGVFVFEDNGRARQLEAAFHTQEHAHSGRLPPLPLPHCHLARTSSRPRTIDNRPQMPLAVQRVTRLLVARRGSSSVVGCCLSSVVLLC